MPRPPSAQEQNRKTMAGRTDLAGNVSPEFAALAARVDGLASLIEQNRANAALESTAITDGLSLEAAVLNVASPGDSGLFASAVKLSDVLSAAIDAATASTRGGILYRGASGWALLAPGTAGQVLTSGGAGADPSWV